MDGRAGVWLTCLVGLALGACGGGPGRSVPEGSGPFAAQLPSPSALRGASYTQRDLFCWGNEYGDALWYDNVQRGNMEGVFSPNWVKPGGQFGDLAYATYQFLLAGFDLDPSVRFTWTETGSFSNGWVALADFPRDTWNWYNLPANGVLAFEPAKHISAHDLMYVVVLFTGTAPWRLQQLRVGVDGAPGDWFMAGHDPQHTRRSPFVGAQTAALNWDFAANDYVSSSPAIGADGTVYVGSGKDYELWAVKPNGHLKWAYAMGGIVSSSPAIGVDGTIYVGGGDSKLYAIKPDGTLKWSYATGGYVESDPAIDGADGTIYVGSSDEKLYAINPWGGLKWAYTTEGRVLSSPAIGTDGTVFVGSDDSKLYAINPDGSFKWSYTTGDWVRSSPAIGTDGMVYVGSDDDKLYAINPDGSLQWAYTTGDYVRSSPAIGSDGTVYVGSDDNKLYAINPDGSFKWSYTTGAGCWVQSSPAIGADGTIYVGSDDYKLYAINPDGSFKWSYTTSDPLRSSPAIGADGTVYVGMLYSFADW